MLQEKEPEKDENSGTSVETLLESCEEVAQTAHVLSYIESHDYFQAFHLMAIGYNLTT